MTFSLKTDLANRIKKTLCYDSIRSTAFANMTAKCLFIVSLIVASFWVQYIAVLAFIALCAFTVLERDEKSLYYILFLVGFYKVFFINISEFRINLSSLSNIFILVFQLASFIIKLISAKKTQKTNEKGTKQNQFPFWPFIFIAAFIGYTLIPFGKINLSGSFNMLYLLTIVLVFVLCARSLDLKELITLYSLGLIISCIAAPIGYQIPRILNQIPQFEVNSINRFSALTPNPNILHILISFSIIPLCYLYLKKRIGWEFYPLFISTSVAGFLTVSRLFMAIYLLFFVVFAFYNYGTCFIRYKQTPTADIPAQGSSITTKLAPILKASASILCIVAALIISSSVFNKFTEANLDRMGNTISDIQIPAHSPVVWPPGDEIFGKYDPGRSNLLKIAFDDWVKSPKSIIFGVGLGWDATKIGITSEHNTFMMLLRQTGLVGSALFALTILCLYCHLNEKKIRLKPGFSWTLLFTFFIVAFMEPLLSISPITLATYLTLLMFLLTDENKKKKTKKAPNEINTEPSTISTNKPQSTINP